MQISPRSAPSPAGCLHQLFAAQAARVPHAVAVVGPGEELTYGELASRANRLARLLRARGVGPEVPVGLCVGGTTERVVALLAILLAGGAYVPLDPADPAERLAFLLADCRAPLALAESRFADLLPAAVPTLLLDREGEARAAESPDPLSCGAVPENLAYVIYTSGSTGRPKGVLATHGGAVNLVREAVRLFGAGAETRVLQGASLGFDASVLEIFLALSAGGRLILGRDRRPLAGPELAERLARERVTTLATPPPLLATLDPEALPDLTHLILGGDSCPPATAARWAPGRRLWNAYAPTEATVFATAWQAPQGTPALPTVLPIGKPIANLTAYLVDGDLAPLPAAATGEAGEIALGGRGLARGYLGRPDRTAERFVPHPWAGNGAPAGDRLYRSGDLGRRLPSGDLEFLGRADRQVKIRGVRVEPGEVEAALLALPAVAEAAVVPREDTPGDRRLVAYLAARETGGEDLSARRLREDLGRLLPAAMIPSAFVLLERLPRTANGKIDRAALPAPSSPMTGGPAGEPAAPRGEVEETLAALFRELLGLPRIGVRDSFFELGGHSLLAAQLAARVRRILGAELPLDLLFAHPTVEQLARALGERAGAPESPPLPPLVPGPRPAAIPLSFPQERVWFLDRLAPGSVAYDFQCEIRLRGPLVPAALARALSEVVRRHEILRTRFPEVEGRPVQVIEPPWEVPLPVVDLAALGAAARERAARECVAAAIRRPFAVDRLPLLSWHLVRLAPEDHLFLQIEHHLVHDGWSLSVLTREIADLYAAFVAGRPSPLPEPSLQYADFALWQRGWLAGEALERQLGWWRERLAAPPPVLELPADHPRPAAHSFRGGALLRPVPAALASALRERSRRSGATLFMTLFAGFAALLSRLSGQEDLAVGTGVANRRLAETERMLGMVVNTLVLRADLSRDPDFLTLLARVRETVLGAQAHQDLPFEKLVAALRPERRLAVNPLFQVLFSFHDSPMPELSFGGLTGRLTAAPNGSAKADLNVVAVPVAEQRVDRPRGEAAGFEDDLEILWEYSADLFDRPTAVRMLERYLTLLAAAVAEPDRRLADLPLLAAAERHQLVAEWNDSARPLPEGGSVHGGFLAAAAEGPERTAAVFGGAHLSYGELAVRASRRARDLSGLGVGPEVPVALYLERSPELVVAILAVLLAGGCYVPLDPSHPAERQRLLLEDTGAPLLLTLSRRGAEAAELVRAVPGVRILHLDDPAGRTPRAALPPPSGGDRLCYVLYTSGSTGKPKGVGVSHNAVLRLVHGGFVDLGPGVRVGHVSNTAFDAATFELWGALLTGATLVGLPGDEAVTPRGLSAAFAAGRVDTLFLTATLFAELAREEPGAYAPLRAVLFGGEAADPSRVREVLRAGPPGRLLNGYGPTECTTFAAVHAVGSLPSRAPRVPIGRPLGNTRALVLDRSFRPQPIGVPGELCLGGAGLARGYLGRPERTAERFVPDPLSERPGERLYKTGDLARVLPDGSLDLLGRLDGQVKVRGFRLELGEVEAALGRHPDVAAAAVAVRGEGMERRLVGYVVARTGESELLAGLRAYLKPLLPEPMIPAAFLALPALPKNPNGKLDRAALPSPEGALRGEAEAVPPRTPVEAALAGLWAELLPLGGRAVGVHDNFFDLGGHSLLATRVISRLLREYGVEVPLRALFEAPTVESLAAVVEGLRESGGAARRELLQKEAAAPRTAPLSFGQERLWFLDRLSPGLPVYNVPRALALTGPLDVAALSRAASGVVARHEALRATFGAEGDRPVQTFAPPAAVRLPVVDLSGLPAGRRRPAAEALAGEEAARPFDLARGPLLRLTLLRLAAESHLLLSTVHHIAFDGWSEGLFWRELSALYRGLPLSPPLPYTDFVRWQRREPSGEAAAALALHWRAKLAGAPALQELPTARPRPAAPSFRGASAPVHLPPGPAAALAREARRLGATPFMVHLAVFAALLGRASGREDLVLGTPVAGRDRPELEGTIGLFVNTLALRLDLGGDPGFSELLGRVRETCLDAYAHAGLPFERLVEELRPERAPGANPLFQTLFVFQTAPPGRLDLPGVLAAPLPVHSRTSRMDLLIELREGEEGPAGIAGRIEYALDLFDPPDLARLAEHWRTLAEGAAAAPGERLSALPLLAAAERHQLLSEWNDGARPLPADGSVHGRFLAAAAEGPERTAAVFGAGHLSYGELAARADRLARELAGLGVGPEVPVALYLERSPELVVATLAVLLSGGCYVPLDPSHPAERQRLLLADTGAPLLLTVSRRAAEAAELARALPGVAILSLDDPAGRAPRAALPRPSGGDRLCYVIYTSGSTGRPKGVGISHQAVLRLVHGGFVDLGPGIRVGHVSNTAFDAATFELWGALLTGATLVGLAGDEAVTPRGLIAAFAAGRIDTLFLTATLFAEVAREDPRAFGPLQAVLFGGEAADPSRVREVLEAGPPGRLLNGYGPTECTTFAVVHRTGSLPAGAPRVPIGRPIGNTRALVLDRSLSPQPIGVPGELCLGGAGLARGYLGRPERTAERFVPDPLSERPGERLYKTGDLVRVFPDGALDLLGRLDGQVKVRGFRIELGEVEAALGRHPEVAAAAVAVRGTGAERRLVGYVVPRDGRAGEADLPAGLRAYLAPLLPEPMIPTVFLPLPALPRNPNGKLDRAALPAPEGALSTGTEFVPPRTPIEALIAGFWSELLPVGGRAVGVHDNFFELGGHSLLATRVLSRLLREHGVEVPLRALFDRPTVAGLAEALAQIAEALALAGRSAAALSRGPIPRRDLADLPLPLSFAQQRLWFLTRLAPESPFYNTPAAVCLEGPLAVPALARSLDEVVRRHEALRTSFPETAGEPVQSIAPAAPVPLPRVDLGALPEAAREPEARRLAAAELARPFDLGRGPLLRARLFQRAADDHRLLLSLHHIVSDGWSIGVLLRELSLLYGAFAVGRPSPLPELALQYADYAVWQRRQLTGELLSEQLAYWRERLEGLAPLELPADRPRPPVQRFRGARRPFALAPAPTAALRRLAREQRGSLYVALLAGFAILLARLSGQEDLALGSPIANRQQPELEPLIGFFVNTLVLRVDAQGDPTLSVLFAHLRETALAADAHQDLPFERLVEELNPVRDASRNPLVQAVFALQNTPLPEPVAAGTRFSLTGVGSTASRFDLFVSLWELDGGLSGYLEYDTDLFAATTAERWSRHLESLLVSLPSRLAARLSDLPLLSPAEIHQLLREWNPGAAPPPPASSAPTLDRLFAAQAVRTPGATALVVGEERLTYAELLLRVERLAGRLAELGVGPEVPVALFLPRTADLVVSLLATLSAGGFYVPLDPAYPAERLAYLTADSGAALLLTLRDLRDRAPAGVRPLLVDEIDETASAPPPAPRSLPESLAYLIYTSGSTGRPKAVAISHASAGRRVEWARETYSAEELRAVLAATSLAFDLSVFEIFAPLAIGGAVVLADHALALPNLPARDEVTLLNTVPSAVAELLRQEALPRSVRTINLAGEPLPRALADQVHARPWVERLYNLYGPSEDTTYSTVARVERESRRAPAIGRPLAGTAAHVLGPSGEPMPVGAPGELYLGGAGLARGYLGRPERTAERFLPDPFADRPGARLYRTGDLVRRQPGGDLDFLGRLDDQVKVRGFRIELGEVEAALAACPGVAAAAVLARADGASSPRLVAYVVAGSAPAPSAPSIAALRSALQVSLPDFMVPTAWVFLPALPLTPNGKLDRRALPAPEPERRETAAVPPRTPEEAILAQVWAEVLHLPEVGIDDNFFELGGDSIRGVQVVARCRERGLPLAPHLLFRHQTIAALAAALAPAPAAAEKREEAAGASPESESSLAAEFPEAALSEAELADLLDQLA